MRLLRVTICCREQAEDKKRIGGYEMCDYSLQGLPNRLAVEGEQLVTYRFPTGSVGLATPLDIAAGNRSKPQRASDRSWWSALKHLLNPQIELGQVPAVCIPPGAQLFMSHITEELRRKFALQAVAVVTFVQFSADSYRYRDGIRFRNGKQLSLQEITENVRFEVISLESIQSKTWAERRRISDPIGDTMVRKHASHLPLIT